VAAGIQAGKLAGYSGKAGWKQGEKLAGNRRELAENQQAKVADGAEAKVADGQTGS
jgi:hypothetical protein